MSSPLQFIDSHAHLTSPDVLPHLESILERAQKAHLCHIINVCTDPKSLEAGMALEKRHPWIRNAGATTPHDVEKQGAIYFEIFAAAARMRHLIAIGETGLDYYYQHSNRSVQQEFLIRYLHLALECHLPMIIHCRDAFDDLFAIADREYPQGHPAVMHCFTGELNDAKRALDRGWMISFSGIVTFTKSDRLRDIARTMPIDSILIETDTPYLAPQSKRGQPNEPSFIQETLDCLAFLKGVPPEEMARVTTNNARRVFLLP